MQYGQQSLGVLRLQERPGLALTTVEERLFVALASQAGLMLRLVAVRAELEDRHQELVARAGELQASRDRLSKPRTPNGGAWSATSTTALSSIWWPWR